MHSGTVWNDREHFENNDAESCILISYSIWFGTAEKKQKQGRQLICAFWCYFKRFGTAEKILKILLRTQNREFRIYFKRFNWNWKKRKKSSLMCAFWCYLKRFVTAEKKNENKNARSCAFWCYLKRFMWNCNKKNVFTKSRLNNLNTR